MVLKKGRAVGRTRKKHKRHRIKIAPKAQPPVLKPDPDPKPDPEPEPEPEGEAEVVPEPDPEPDPVASAKPIQGPRGGWYVIKNGRKKYIKILTI